MGLRVGGRQAGHRPCSPLSRVGEVEAVQRFTVLDGEAHIFVGVKCELLQLGTWSVSTGRVGRRFPTVHKILHPQHITPWRDKRGGERRQWAKRQLLKVKQHTVLLKGTSNMPFTVSHNRVVREPLNFPRQSIFPGQMFRSDISKPQN